MPGVEDYEVDTMARTIWGEARSEGPEGMKAVANVIAHRVQRAREYKKAKNQPHAHYGDGTFSDSCRQSSHFSCWNEDDPSLSKLLSVDGMDKQFVEAKLIAKQAIDGQLEDNTNDATHYHRMSIAVPEWTVGMFLVSIIGQHVFYRFHDIVVSI